MRQTWVLLATCALIASGVSAQEAGGKPDLAKAQKTVDTVCAACHGSDGNSTNAANPSLAGQQAQYITLQLMHFKNGIRSNPVMAAMAANLTAEDMQALGAYFAAQTPKGLAAKDPVLAAAGQKLFRGGDAASGTPACAACHAPSGSGIPIRYPRLSGQYADYTFAQLQAFKAGQRGLDKEGRDVNGKIMNQIAARMSEHDMRAVAEYASGLH